MNKELKTKYDFKEVEQGKYEFWLRGGFFTAGDKEKEPFTIVIPPPNVTGKLHLGHACDTAFQDIIIRRKRMQGYDALWLPGMDHAGIATQAKVDEKLKSQGISRYDIGREKFLEVAWKWKADYAKEIHSQWAALGLSLDYSKERFTLDEQLNKAVNYVFISLYNKGYIYQGKRIINWDPEARTALSNIEVEHKDVEGAFYYFNYPFVDGSGSVMIATTRPETMFADQAIMVHPLDERYQAIIGKKVYIPGTKIEIPVIADSYVDQEFGTGCVKITPAHDPNDFEVGKRHHLAEITIMNDDATINKNGGKYQGMDRYEARKVMVKELEEAGLLVKVVPHSHNVGTHDRCKTTVEPMVKQQWFVKMDEMIQPAVQAVKDGKVKLLPERMEKIYFNWTDHIRDWCISRQLWWGHPIPAYYCDNCKEFVVAKKNPGKCPKCGCTSMTQDPDTLDTWFSSALWPFSTLGWPKKTEDLDYFYPTDVLVTGYDIIFFWVIRMIFSGYEQMGKAPFHTVLFHGLVRDAQGRKMSKSLGNGIDPLEVIEKYGADALRMTLVTGNAPGNDMRFYYERVEASRNFANKVWNASRFIMMNLEKADTSKAVLSDLTAADRWILSKVNTLVKEVTENLDKYEMGIALQKVYDFVWEEFCDWYIEMVKPRLWKEEDTTKATALWTLKTVLITALKLLHPYMPFVTEEIFCNIQEEEESIMISDWPLWKEEWNFSAEEREVEMIKEAVRGIRNVRTSMNVAPSKKATVYVVSEEKDVREVFERSKVFFGTLGYASEVFVQADRSGIAEDAVSAVIHRAVIYIPFAELVDVEKEKERLEKEKERLKKELNRVNGMLGNERFISKAPEEKIAEEKGKLVKYTEMMEQVEERLRQLQKSINS